MIIAFNRIRRRADQLGVDKEAQPDFDNGYYAGWKDLSGYLISMDCFIRALERENAWLRSRLESVGGKEVADGGNTVSKP